MFSIDIGLAFIEGLALIVSPCILPVLPLVLATSVDGGRRRPYGIVIGFVLAFSLFAIVARKFIALFGVDLELVRNVSLVLLALFGLVLLSSTLSEKFSAITQSASNLGNDLASTAGEGLPDGIVIGLLIGLVWTPCAGPILAAALVQVIRQQSDLNSAFIIVSFSLGACIPMLVIALLGKRIMGKLGFIAKHAQAMRRIFGSLILASVALIAYGVDTQVLFASSSKETIGASRNEHALQNALTYPYKAPEFSGIKSWFNSEPLTMQSLKGKVVLIDFWTYACINCVRNLPYIVDWDKKYRSMGLTIIGVHTPEFEFERRIENVEAAIEQHGVRYPVALDDHTDTWLNFDNHSWPAQYLIDRDGRVVYTHFGEGEYEVTENNIRYLLGHKGHATNEAAKPNYPAAPTHQSRTVKVFKDCYSCSEMVVIPAGSFEIGKGTNAHRVIIEHSFALSKFEVTQAEWKAVMGNNPSHFKGVKLPVEQVSWNDIHEFIQKLNQKTGKQYRLPSETEWEYACRANELNDYCGSNDVSSVAWYGAFANTSGNSGKTTNPVGAKRANAFGLYDMSGNVWEWIEDPWHDNYNDSPTDGSVWQGDGAKRVIRGGSWLDYPLLARADFRVWAGVGKRSNDLGFRLARPL
jgi:formylglycine-generating enzyme required for sulfatase activity/cytochrome c biogenesis protein CcdA